MRRRHVLFLRGSLGTKIGVIFAFVCLLTISAVAWEAMRIVKANMAEQQLRGAVRVLENLTADKGATFERKDGLLVLDGGKYVLSESTEIVDQVSRLTGCNATFFLGDTRISTNVKTTSGERATGTKAAPEVVQRVLQEGSDFQGTADVAGALYMTYYKPIRNTGGSTIGMLFVGIPLGEFNRAALLAQKRLLALGIAGVVAATVSALVVLRKSLRPIQRVAEVAEAVAGGNLQVQAPSVSSQDEVQVLCDAFRKMVDSLKTMVDDVSRVAEEVSSSSEEMSATAEQSSNAIQQVAKAAQDAARTAESQAREVGGAGEAMKGLKEALAQIAKGSQDQARATHETSGAVKEIVHAIQGISHSAGSLASASEETRKSAETGRDAMGQTVNGIKEIGEVASRINDSIAVLAARSDKIGEIVGVIDEIASQTNLLALNAAIEAARAGDHGRGFAVVADEVRKLAERSAKSTKEISELIAEIQKGTTASVDAIDEGVKAVEKGVELGAFASKAIQAILDVAKSTDENVRSIVAAINQVSASSDQVEKAVEQIASTAEESTAATEEVTASAKQVEDLLQSVGAAAGTASTGAEEISASSEELGASSEEMASSAQSLAKMAQGIKALVERFKA